MDEAISYAHTVRQNKRLGLERPQQKYGLSRPIAVYRVPPP